VGQLIIKIPLLDLYSSLKNFQVKSELHEKQNDYALNIFSYNQQK